VSEAVGRRARGGAVRGAVFVRDGSEKGEWIEALHLPRLTGRFDRVDTHRSRE